ncbi:hypothetical protein ACQCVH_09435 [Bacillus infantis]
MKLAFADSEAAHRALLWGREWEQAYFGRLSAARIEVIVKVHT